MTALEPLTVKKEVYLHPGEFGFSGDDGAYKTILGSCVSITVWHPILRLGGMTHFVLPSRSFAADRSSNGGRLEGRFGDESMILMDNAIRQYGLHYADCQVKVFGGAKVNDADLGMIGQRNITQAELMLKERGIKPLAQHTGGKGNRRLTLDLSTGEVWMKHQQTVVELEL